MTRRKFLMLRLAAYVVVCFGLMFWISRSRREGTFERFVAYWAALSESNADAYDAEVVLRSLRPLLDEKGVALLWSKATTGEGEEMAVAVVALDTILDAVRYTPQKDPAAVERILRPVRSANMDALNERAMAATKNPLLRELLGRFAHEPEDRAESATNGVPVLPSEVGPAAGAAE